MSHTHAKKNVLRYGAALLVATALGGCASHKHNVVDESITPQAPFSRTFTGSGDVVCWSVKRAMLSQGYMLDRSAEQGVLTGTRDFQPKDKLNVTLHLQTSCADNHDGTSIVFVTATREDSELQKMKQTTSMGVGPATLTMPSGSARVLGTVRRETVHDAAFYNSFFGLVDGFVKQEDVAQTRRHAEERADRNDEPRGESRNNE
ncbi:MAG TPA: DUF2242 domain-containing protein [Steroidobacteraceae bacterium]|jgi:hypothetical protein|nr:DUF2242 domain-containing protein [Steroidobacteraceae bacterium]